MHSSCFGYWHPSQSARDDMLFHDGDSELNYAIRWIWCLFWFSFIFIFFFFNKIFVVFASLSVNINIKSNYDGDDVDDDHDKYDGSKLYNYDSLFKSNQFHNRITSHMSVTFFHLLNLYLSSNRCHTHSIMYVST